MPLRGGIDLIRDDRLIGSPTLAPYLRDVEEHLMRVTEMADAVRDLLTSLLEVRVGQTANDLNEVMKKLSAWAGIILVPTLIAGIYGMNFTEMPELGLDVGYPLALGDDGGIGVPALAQFQEARVALSRGSDAWRRSPGRMP